MATKTSVSIDFQAIQEKLNSQFQDLDPRDPSAWPPAPRYGLFALATIVVIVVLWFVWLSGAQDA